MHLFVLSVVVVVVSSFGNTEGIVEWDYYYGANASTENEEGPLDTKVKNVILFSIIIWLNPQAGKMKRIMFSDWSPDHAKWACLARSRNDIGLRISSAFFFFFFFLTRLCLAL